MQGWYSSRTCRHYTPSVTVDCWETWGGGWGPSKALLLQGQGVSAEAGVCPEGRAQGTRDRHCKDAVPRARDQGRAGTAGSTCGAERAEGGTKLVGWLAGCISGLSATT